MTPANEKPRPLVLGPEEGRVLEVGPAPLWQKYGIRVAGPPEVGPGEAE